MGQGESEELGHASIHIGLYQPPCRLCVGRSVLQKWVAAWLGVYGACEKRGVTPIIRSLAIRGATAGTQLRHHL